MSIERARRDLDAARLLLEELVLDCNRDPARRGDCRSRLMRRGLANIVRACFHDAYTSLRFMKVAEPNASYNLAELVEWTGSSTVTDQLDRFE